MATLTGKTIQNTYKDLLTVSGTTLGEGLESSVKRVFDGEGIGSPFWLGSNSLEFQGDIVMGAASSTGNYDFSWYGDVSSGVNPWMKFDASEAQLQLNDVSIKMTGTAVAMEAGTNKGKIKLGDNTVTLQKGSDTLLEVKDDGSFALSPKNTAPDVNTSSDGDMYVDSDGNLNIFQT